MSTDHRNSYPNLFHPDAALQTFKHFPAEHNFGIFNNSQETEQTFLISCVLYAS